MCRQYSRAFRTRRVYAYISCVCVHIMCRQYSRAFRTRRVYAYISCV